MKPVIIKHMSGNTVTVKTKNRGSVSVLEVKSTRNDPNYNEPSYVNEQLNQLFSKDINPNYDK